MGCGRGTLLSGMWEGHTVEWDVGGEGHTVEWDVGGGAHC